MFTARPQKNLQHAKQYFREHLGHGDYYSENQKVRGVWFGQGAARLGLTVGGSVTESEFVRLCDNQHPETGTQLTVRQRRVDRRVFHDFQVAPPKSISLMALVVGDERIVEAHTLSSRAALAELEQLAATRIRRAGQVRNHVTGEIVAAEFLHDASRSLDPQLHTHFVVFNATFDNKENRWKALDTRGMFDAIRFVTEVYRNELARRLQALGYRLRPTANGFEIAGVSEELIQRFSKRRQAILAEAARLEQELKHGVSNNSRAAIAHALRERKLRNLTAAEVRAFQRAQLSQEELAGLQQLMVAPVTSGAAAAVAATLAPAVASHAPEGMRPPGLKLSPQAPATTAVAQPATHLGVPTEAARHAIDFARDHLFERKSVVSRQELLTVALEHGRGRVTLDELKAELARRTELHAEGAVYVTQQGLREERRLIALVNAGVGQCRPLRPGFRSRLEFTPEQERALAALLQASDRVMVLRGAAGSGKTEVLQGFAEAMQNRHEFFLLATTRGSVKALQDRGLNSAQTVQWFLTNDAVRQISRNPVVVVDEAGLLSNRQMLALVEWVQLKQGRLLLSGDSRQHSSVEAGDALRILEKFSAIQKVPLREVQRQTNPEYRAAIADLAEGRGERAVDRLERLGAIAVLDDDVRCQRAAEGYVASLQAGKSALAVCPTWHEADVVNAAIRAQLQQLGKVSRRERTVAVHRSLKWTQAQKRDFAGYKPGLVLNFHTSTHTFKAGESAEVLQVQPDRLIVRKGCAGEAAITRKQLGCFDVAKVLSLPVAKHDRLVIQGNRKAAHLINGQFVTVESVAPNGAIRLTNGHSVPPDFRLFTYGHAVTSQTAQGRTVDHVHVVMNQYSQAANEKALYVGASRGRERVRLYCDDEETPRRAVKRPGNREAVTERLQVIRQRQTVETSRQVKVRVVA